MSDQPVTRPDQTLSESQLLPTTSLPPVTLNAPPNSDAPQTRSEAGKGPGAPQPERERLGRFEVHSEIGRGGMGAVLRGHDPALGRDLALKVLLAGRQGNADSLRRFHEEAQIGGQLQHPGLVPVYEMGADGDGRPFFAMKLVDGQTLAELLKERASPTDNLPRFLTIFEQVCQALAYAHARGVIHRDLKPANVMVGAFGEVQVMDWGLAKVLESKGTDTVVDDVVGSERSTVHTERSESGGSESRSGSVMGTPAYMPPEQARGEIDHLNQRADVFGLGAILCEILTGQPAFIGANVQDILRRSASGNLTETFARLDGCGADAELIGLGQKCLQAEADARPRDGSEVAAQVAAYRSSVEERLRRAELDRAAAEVRAVEERRRRRVQLALAGAVLLMLLLGGSGGWWLRHQQVERRQEVARHEAELREEHLKGQAEQERHAAKLREQSLERQAAVVKQESERARHAAELVRVVEDDLNRLAAARQERKWDEAEKVLERVQGRLGQSGGDQLQLRVARARDDLARVRRDQQMNAKLEEAKLFYAGVGGKGLSTLEANRQRFEQAFAWYELDVQQGSPEEVAARLRDRSIREELVIALDWWADFCQPPEAIRLRLIAQAADASAWRRRLRGALLRGDYDLIRQLADDPQVAEQPPATIAYLAYVLQLAKAPDRSIAVLQEGRLRSPTSFWLNFDLAVALQKASPPKTADAVRYYTAAQTLRPDSLFVLLNLGSALEAQNNLPEAEASYRQAIRLRPDYYRAYNWLGNVLFLQKNYAEAVSAYREAIRLEPSDPLAHYNFGIALFNQGKLTEAVAAYREALRLKPDQPLVLNNLGVVLKAQGKLAAAVTAFRETIRLMPDNPRAHYNLGIALHALGKLPQAVVAYREAIRLKFDDPVVHSNLGSTLKAQGKLPEAASAYREAIRLKPDDPLAHCNLAFILRQQREFVASRDAFRRGHELGAKTPGWRAPSAQWLRQAERIVELDGRLPDILGGKAKPATAAEQIEFAVLCDLKRRYVAAVRLYASAFLADARLANDLIQMHRYNAAWCAILAANGKSEDEKSLDAPERARLRTQALGWLRDDLTTWGKRLDGRKPPDFALVASKMLLWQQNPDLAAVRDADAVAKLPEVERADWQKLWHDVDALLKRAAASK